MGLVIRGLVMLEFFKKIVLENKDKIKYRLLSIDKPIIRSSLGNIVTIHLLEDDGIIVNGYLHNIINKHYFDDVTDKTDAFPTYYIYFQPGEYNRGTIRNNETLHVHHSLRGSAEQSYYADTLSNLINRHKGLFTCLKNMSEI